MKYLLSLIVGLLGYLFNAANITDQPNPNIENWISLFNGKDFNDWDIKIANRPLNDNYLNTFQVENGIMRIVYDEYKDFDDKYGHMYYKKSFSHYKLRFDYRFIGDQTPGGEGWNIRNSGIMVHSQSAGSNTYEQHFPVSIEV